jgi:hypothetical protein
MAFAIGAMLLGSAFMVMAGAFHVMTGAAAILDEEFYGAPPEYDLQIDATAWGWIHLVGGVIASVTGALLLSGARWARIAAITIALWSCIWSFYSIPYYPVWSLIIIAIDLGLIWALVRHGKELSEEGP